MEVLATSVKTELISSPGVFTASDVELWSKVRTHTLNQYSWVHVEEQDWWGAGRKGLEITLSRLPPIGRCWQLPSQSVRPLRVHWGCFWFTRGHGWRKVFFASPILMETTTGGLLFCLLMSELVGSMKKKKKNELSVYITLSLNMEKLKCAVTIVLLLKTTITKIINVQPI